MPCNSDKYIVKRCTAVAGSTIVLMARVAGTDNVNLTQGDVSAIRVDVYEIGDGDYTAVDSSGAEITDGSAYEIPDVSDTVYDTLQTDSRWQEDSSGYNVAYKFAAPLRAKTYELRLTLTVGDDNLIVVWQVDSQ